MNGAALSTKWRARLAALMLEEARGSKRRKDEDAARQEDGK